MRVFIGLRTFSNRKGFQLRLILDEEFKRMPNENISNAMRACGKL